MPQSNRPRIGRLLSYVVMSTFLLSVGCGGSDDNDDSASTGLSGDVATGAPLTDALLRILDASGEVVVENVEVNADGSYSNVALTGEGPYRIEVCGYSGPEYLCLYSVAQGNGIANVTPLTSAIVLLATGEDPGSLMSGAVEGLDESDIEDVQTTLQETLESVLDNADLSDDFDFISGSLNAGSRTGYDRVLDVLDITTGVDDAAFVQISPRLGEGNLYLEAGAAAEGELTIDDSAADLSLTSLEVLFNNMSAAMESQEACLNETTGLASQISTNSQFAGEDEPAFGPTEVAAELCGFFENGEDGQLWGSEFLSPTLGKCDLSDEPRCRVSFVLQLPDGEIMPVGSGMAVQFEDNLWKFAGDINPLAMYAGATAQRGKRADDPTAVINYDRALQFDIQAYDGLECVSVSQQITGGGEEIISYYKKHSSDAERLSGWRVNAFGTEVSLDPNVGETRSTDDTWLHLPQGDEGDNVIRNFYRNGREVRMALYSDTTCSTPFTVGGASTFEIEVEGVPPVWASMPNLPWPELTASALSEIEALTLTANQTATYNAAWTFSAGRMGFDGATFCKAGDCADGGPNRIGEADFSRSASSVEIPITNSTDPVAAEDFKMLSLYGRNSEGMAMQSNLQVCTGDAAGQMCQ
ncbi:MAG: hypothetical protein V4629_00840 [Pseudomonadota bacterium]